MKSVRKKDFYEVRLMGRLEPLPFSSLIDLYLPIIGSDALAIYLGLSKDESAAQEALIQSHDKLFDRLALSPGEFYEGMEKLEAVALVATFHKAEKDQAYFIYCLSAPKAPEDFFQDVLLSGALRLKLASSEVESLEKKYALAKEPDGFANVGASFSQVFHPDFSDPAFRFAPEKRNRAEAKIKTDFDWGQFISLVQKNGIAEETIAKAERKLVEQYATLYAIDPESMLEVFLRSFHPKASFGQRLERIRFEKECKDLLSFPYLKKAAAVPSDNSGTNAMARKISLMDSVSPARYLYFFQDAHEPASGDLAIAEMLMTKMGLSAPLTNAVIDYVLQTNDNILAKTSCEKLSAAVLREGCKTSRDALDYLNSISEKRRSYRKKKVFAPQPELKEEAPKKAEEEPKEEEVTDEMVKKALASLYNK